MDRFIKMNLDQGTINSRNEMKSYTKMQQEIRMEFCKGAIIEEKPKKESIINTPKKPIDKKNFMNNIQNEIEVKF
jgi:hypothetical protein